MQKVQGSGMVCVQELHRNWQTQVQPKLAVVVHVEEVAGAKFGCSAGRVGHSRLNLLLPNLYTRTQQITCGYA